MKIEWEKSKRKTDFGLDIYNGFYNGKKLFDIVYAPNGNVSLGLGPCQLCDYFSSENAARAKAKRWLRKLSNIIADEPNVQPKALEWRYNSEYSRWEAYAGEINFEVYEMKVPPAPFAGIAMEVFYGSRASRNRIYYTSCNRASIDEMKQEAFKWLCDHVAKMPMERRQK